MDILSFILDFLSDKSVWLTSLVSILISLLSNYLTSQVRLSSTVDKIQKIILVRISKQSLESTKMYEKYSSVYGVMFAKRMKEANFVSIAFSVFILVYLAISTINHISTDPLIIFISFTLLFLPWVKLGISAYRVSKGFLGSSEYEIRQFIHYILSEASDDDLNDGGHPRKLVDLKDFSTEKIKLFDESPSRVLKGLEGKL
ncbi:hypothetical protein [Vibrio harveyi]